MSDIATYLIGLEVGDDDFTLAGSNKPSPTYKKGKPHCWECGSKLIIRSGKFGDFSCITIKQLKEKIKNLPDEMEVRIGTSCEEYDATDINIYDDYVCIDNDYNLEGKTK